MSWLSDLKSSDGLKGGKVRNVIVYNVNDLCTTGKPQCDIYFAQAVLSLLHSVYKGMVFYV